MPELIVKKESDFDKLLDTLKEKYMDEGMREFEAKTKDVMSEEDKAKNSPEPQSEEKEEKRRGENQR